MIILIITFAIVIILVYSLDFSNNLEKETKEILDCKLKYDDDTKQVDFTKDQPVVDKTEINNVVNENEPHLNAAETVEEAEELLKQIYRG